jgi:glycerophosphoryl diester phosphodiesterase
MMVPATTGRPAVVAHRGHSAVAPENTLVAVAAARQARADWIEVDVRTSADGVPVVIHDRTVDRTTDGTGAVAELTAAQITALDAGSWFSAEGFGGERVPTFAGVLDDVRRRGGRLLVDIKPPQSPDGVAAITAMVRERGLSRRVMVQSFDPTVVAAARAAAPDLRRALLTDGRHGDPVAACREVGAGGYHTAVEDVLGNPGIVGELHAAGLAVMAWTANDDALWPALSSVRVNGIITDRVADLRRGLTDATPRPPRRPRAGGPGLSPSASRRRPRG